MGVTNGAPKSKKSMRRPRPRHGEGGDEPAGEARARRERASRRHARAVGLAVLPAASRSAPQGPGTRRPGARQPHTLACLMLRPPPRGAMMAIGRRRGCDARHSLMEPAPRRPPIPSRLPACSHSQTFLFRSARGRPPARASGDRTQLQVTFAHLARFMSIIFPAQQTTSRRPGHSINHQIDFHRKSCSSSATSGWMHACLQLYLGRLGFTRSNPPCLSV